MTDFSDAAQMEMPKYDCHKQVWALQIKKFRIRVHDDQVLFVPVNSMFSPIELDADYMAKHNPQAGGYYVVYEDGYKSFSPEGSFEGGYSLVGSTINNTFQSRVNPWMQKTFGDTIASDVFERNHRFLEESMELVQACNCTAEEAHMLVDYVFSRPVGDKPQEVGGVMVTLAALCLAQSIDMHDAGDNELARIWTKVEEIREKQATNPNSSPLPV